MALWSQVLRSILMLGLEERIHYGKAAIGVTDIGDRAILAFADGTTAHADIVIGADGANSALRAHATPGREPVELPVAAIYGSSPIETLPKELSDSGVLALEGAPGRGAFFASIQYREAPTALRDAAVLAKKLRTLPPTQALAAYLKDMGAYAFKEVEASVKQMKRLTQTGQLAQWLMLRAMPRLHKRTV
ncbi:FAD-dependent monooxygenase [Streptomyces mirabilis]|uniref:FAD-dependent oxidoreductase n=1 Tax=Streptomyces mirabilis TaxID=68239 RepID=UPI003719952F